MVRRPIRVVADLEARLRRASAADNWSQVIHRCAWCKRVFDADGTRTVIVPIDDTIVATDGMCPPCGARALAQVAARHNRLAA